MSPGIGTRNMNASPREVSSPAVDADGVSNQTSKDENSTDGRLQREEQALVYIDETAELDAFYRHHDGPVDDDEIFHDELSAVEDGQEEEEEQPEDQAPSITSAAHVSATVEDDTSLRAEDESWPLKPPTDLPETHPNQPVAGFEAHVHQSASWKDHGSMIFHSTPPQTTPTILSGICESPVTGGLVKLPTARPTSLHHGALEVTLLRYFIDDLARWFDLCDPEKHFELVVPQRARWCPPLMNAILAASARHLNRVQKYRMPSGIVHYDGRPLPELTKETAVHYHNECIRDMLKLSLDPEQTRNENLLAAAIILRFYEEIDSPLRDEANDTELFLRAINIFIDAQIPTVPLIPHSSPMIISPGPSTADLVMNHATTPPGMIQSSSPSDITPTSGTLLGSSKRGRAEGLCQAGFWVAFRQEIYSAFLKQRPFNMSLSRCEIFRSFSPAEDAVWADRLIIFCADVLDFCYGNNADNKAGTGIHAGPTAKENWLKLKELERTWSEILPASFEPIYFREPNRDRGEVFPEICYLADCHVAGVQHVELARILLAVYDPTRPKLGPGHVASMRSLSQELKTIVLRLCGIAVSNRKSPPSMVTALLAIVVCGDHFDDRMEQQALLDVLDEVENEQAWPAGNSREILKQCWGWS
ncbi:uncharacterized protein Z518_05656 [Rhinocladiella mackenziei CBS 650.93]|uniref:ARCA protein n=1 Tax=Rhinocladiella mackenziei CBS 650.93 TaxID=1442369 RepID=A0A0D2J6U0_9EURO|nr:uncharacterized protein Z518_05656 [Rhinocladiella mackenziei CBS 650.93]KIX04785.1 hypothetical protein Z518_05656 [Rhinocladiella mackenziei CBS 650.93]